MHAIEYTGLVLQPDDGLLIGNGDLSVSLYQKPGKLVWRFGKNDVWDRRFDMSENCKPAHIDELIRGIRDEGWVSGSYLDSRPTAKHGTKDEKRMNELCNGSPGYAGRPYPCPKPVGELTLNLPVDQRGMIITQSVLVEKAEAHIECRWDSGVVLKVNCFVPPSNNALVVRWEMENWNEETATGNLPLWFSLWRWEDPSIKEFASRLQRLYGYWYFDWSVKSDKVTPLPPPQLRMEDELPVIEQTFYPDAEFAEGYRYMLAPWSTQLKAIPQKLHGVQDALIQLKPEMKDGGETPGTRGQLVVAVPSSGDKSGAEQSLKEFVNSMKGDAVAIVNGWRDETHRRAAEFWAKSSVEIDDPQIENVWYAVLHARRCAYRSDVIAPGLAFPSTLTDYSMWHGDYHTNYNYQMPFWGNCTANHVEIEDAFFPGMQFMVDLGRKLAKEYWSSRGTYIHLVGFPFEIEDDPYGTGGICRMAYMTGWVSNHYWRRYLYTLDEDWLREKGYPVMRDCALFYTDFLKKWDDGLYHAFPSMQGESFFTGKPEDYTDRPQVVRHAGYCLRSTLEAARVLNLDADLQSEWQDRADNLVDADNIEGIGLDEEQKRRYFLCPPEFMKAYWPELKDPNERYQKRTIENPIWNGIVGFNQAMMVAVRMGGALDPDRDWNMLRDAIKRWTLPNGMQRGLGAEDLGFTGHYAETTGVIAPIQEMMLQSWDGAIKVFPLWPKKVRAKFTTLRAEGAFLVSAEWNDGEVASLSITSEKGRPCRVESPWGADVSVAEKDGTAGGTPVEFSVESGHIIGFETKPGGEYVIDRV